MPKTHARYASKDRRRVVESIRSGRAPGDLACGSQCAASSMTTGGHEARRPITALAGRQQTARVHLGQLLVLSSSVLLQAGCGGGFNTVAPVPAPAASPTGPVAIPASSQALSEADAYGSEDVYTEFDGEDIRVHIAEDGAWSTWLSSVLHATQSSPRRSRLANHSEHLWTLSTPSTRFDEGLTVVANARWHDDNAEDYLAGGWWIRNVGDVTTAWEYGYESSAFIDGPELRGDLPQSISLPLEGHASYRGEAAGHYESTSEVVCITAPCPEPPTGVGTGEFSADATLWADFAYGTIEGCVGCRNGFEMTPTSYNEAAGTIERSDSFILDHLLWLHRGSFLRSPGTLGTFNGDMAAFARAGRPDNVADLEEAARRAAEEAARQAAEAAFRADEAVYLAAEEADLAAAEADPAALRAARHAADEAALAADEAALAAEAAALAAEAAGTWTTPDIIGVGWGSWQGRLSNVDDQEGSPRLVGGTLRGRFDHIAGEAVFTGVLTAESTTYGGRDAAEDERAVQESKDILFPREHLVQGTQAPIVDLDGTLHVGANVAPPADLLTAAESYSGIATSSGWVQDGTAADRVIEFLRQHVGATTSEAGGGYTFTLPSTGLPTFSEPPTVRVASGTSDEFFEYAVRAVQLINAALPYERRIAFGSDRAPPLAAIEDIPDGEIYIDFAATADDWNLVNRDFRPGAAAIAQTDPIQEWDSVQQRWEYKGMRAAHVWFDLERIMNAAWVRNPDTGVYEETLLDMPVTDPEIRVYRAESIFSIMVHELLHELGLLAHNDGEQFADSLMRGSSLLEIQMLPTIDGDALLAAYGRLKPGTEPEDLSAQSLGPWTDTSFHVRGEFDFPGGGVSFGVASRNGRAQPWAAGTTPWMELTDNPVLSGIVTWNGALLGITPSEETVSGSASLAVELSTLSGQLDFTRLESWGMDAAPGEMGSGTRWGDGDLAYSIEVHGNSFVQSGGDAGEVTGMFLGAAHEAMGGVLERADLAAGFGGKR